MYIVISGVHGIGKTTLARAVAEALDAEYLTEAVDDRIPPPVLGPGGNVPLAELWMARQTLLKESRIRDTGRIYVADRAWADIHSYMNVLCTPHEREILSSVMDHFPRRTPDVHIIVHAPTEVITERIRGRKRGRAGEWNEYDNEYVEKVQQAFLDYHDAFKDLRNIRLVDLSGTPEENVEATVAEIRPFLAGKTA